MNSITLYKVDWCYGANLQPYFKSDSSRDSYFAGLTKKQVNLNEPNIKIDFNYEISLKVNIDITEAEQYNFAIINYNNKNHYADILEAAHISIGYSRLELHRNVLCEKTNYFKYFEHFLINKATFNEVTYSAAAKYFLPKDIRYKKVMEEMPFKHIDYDGEVCDTISYRPMLVLFVNNSSDLVVLAGTNLYGEYTQHGMVFIPLPTGTRDNYAIRSGSTPSSYKYWGVQNINMENIMDILNRLSPHIISMHYVIYPMPVKYITTYWEGSEYTDYYNIVPGLGYVAKLANNTPNVLRGMFLINKTTPLPFSPTVVDTFQMDWEGDLEYIFSSLELRFYNTENSIKVDLSRFANGSNVSFRVSFNYIFNINSTEICVRIRNLRGGAIESTNDLGLNYVFPLLDTTHYTVDQKNLFNSENRYYEALTRNTVSQTNQAGKIQATENFALGISQIATGGIAAGAGMPGMALGQVGMGVGNIIRGVGEVAQTANTVKHYKEERRLLALQEQEKPSKTNSGNSAVIRAFAQRGFNYCVWHTPFSNDLYYFYEELYNYGVESFIRRTSINVDTPYSEGNLNDFLNDNKFFMQATATKKRGSSYYLTTREHSEMLKFLNGGCRYFVV